MGVQSRLWVWRIRFRVSSCVAFVFGCWPNGRFFSDPDSAGILEHVVGLLHLVVRILSKNIVFGGGGRLTEHPFAETSLFIYIYIYIYVYTYIYLSIYLSICLSIIASDFVGSMWIARAIGY